MTKKRFLDTRTITFSAVMTALVIVFQGIASFVPGILGPFNTAIALVPIVIGACLCGPLIGAWLGLVFALVVLFTGGAAFFFTFDPFATILIVIAKGMLCGWVSGLVYKALLKVNDILAAIVAALVCPFVNTGVFLLGGIAFLTDDLEALTSGASSGFTAAVSFFFGLGIANFLFEIGLCGVLSPVIVKILNLTKKKSM